MTLNGKLSTRTILPDADAPEDVIRLVLVSLPSTGTAQPARPRCLGLRGFCIGGKRDLSTWEWLARVVMHWPHMAELIEDRGPGPWVYMLNETRVDQALTADRRRPRCFRAFVRAAM